MASKMTPLEQCVPEEKENMSGAGNEAMYNCGWNDARAEMLRRIAALREKE
jgi:hypothetical protein